MHTEIHGTCLPEYAAVKQAFAQNFALNNEIGASFSIVQEGETVVNLWGGSSAPQQQRPWQQDTLSNIWSTTKGVTATCFAMLVDRGLTSYHTPVANHWPEFAAKGKDKITLAMLLSHQAGLCGFRETASVQDFYQEQQAADTLAASAPLWPPGSRSGYHAISIGFLANALMERIDGRNLRDFVAQEISAKFNLDINIGLINGQKSRVADIIAPQNMESSDLAQQLNPSQLAALCNPLLDPLIANTAAWRSAIIPSANGYATAHSLAKLYGALADDGRIDGLTLLRPETIAKARQQQISGLDEVLNIDVRWANGFLCNCHQVYGPQEQSFGHSGWGGSFAFADPQRKLGCAYTVNRMGNELIGDLRSLALIGALYQAS